MEEENNFYLQKIRSNVLFRGLDPGGLEIISKNLQKEKWKKNFMLNGNKRLHHYFFFIISGKIKAFKIDPVSGRECTLFLLGKDEVFDLLCLLDDCEHDIQFQALDQTDLFYAPMGTMRNWLKEYPQINQNLLPYLCKRLRTIEQYVANVSLVDIPSRLALLILTHINENSNQLEMINDLSHEELAGLIGTTRAVVNRHLREFKNDGILIIGRKRVEVKNIKLLLEKIRKRVF